MRPRGQTPQGLMSEREEGVQAVCLEICPLYFVPALLVTATVQSSSQAGKQLPENEVNGRGGRAGLAPQPESKDAQRPASHWAHVSRAGHCLLLPPSVSRVER